MPRTRIIRIQSTSPQRFRTFFPRIEHVFLRREEHPDIILDDNWQQWLRNPKGVEPIVFEGTSGEFRRQLDRYRDQLIFDRRCAHLLVTPDELLAHCYGIGGIASTEDITAEYDE
jgi:hypothetical protein